MGVGRYWRFARHGLRGVRNVIKGTPIGSGEHEPIKTVEYGLAEEKAVV